MNVFVETAPGFFIFDCPGCECSHFVRTIGEEPIWEFNGDLVKPTVYPSIKVQYQKVKDKPMLCHFFIKDGMIQYLDDCTHSLKSTTVPLEPIQ